MERGYFKTWPNNYVVLIGPAGSMKSSSIDIGRELLAKVPGVQFSVDSVSREALIADLDQKKSGGDGTMTCLLHEFGSFFTTSEMAMVLFLIEMYDGKHKYEHKTRGGGSLHIDTPLFNILAGTTPEWLHEGLPIKTQGIGLMSRVLLVYGDEPKDDSWDIQLTPGHSTVYHQLTEDLVHISKLRGPVTLSPEAYQCYDVWYKGRKATQNPDPRLQGFYNRKKDHVWKVAMALMAGRRDTMVIQPEDIEDALVLLGDIEATIPQAMAASGKNPYAVDYLQIHQAIATKEEGLTRAELMRAFKHSLSLAELIKVLGDLEEMKLIKQDPQINGGRYRALAAPVPLPQPS